MNGLASLIATGLNILTQSILNIKVDVFIIILVKNCWISFADPKRPALKIEKSLNQKSKLYDLACFSIYS